MTTSGPGETEDALLLRAIALAEASVDAGGGPFGAVVARDGRVLGEGTNRVVPDADPTAHAELLALRAAARALGTHDLSGCVLYASCEPCPMCLGALLWSRVSRVVHAADRGTAAAAGFDDARFHRILAGHEPGPPLEQRLADEGARPFARWHACADRVPY